METLKGLIFGLGLLAGFFGVLALVLAAAGLKWGAETKKQEDQHWQ